MSAHVVLALTAFAACAVEMVEALTIVLAAGTTRGWRPALHGAAVAVLVLAAVVAAVGPALVSLVPLWLLRLVIGAAVLAVGVQWLRKAIQRAAGRRARRDEDAAYRRWVTRLSGPAGARQAGGFAVAFKGVLLEGTEVVVIVLTLGGASGGGLGFAAAGAAAAVLVVGLAGLLVARQLREVPENALKLGVGIMLVSFGSFWVAEGAGVRWPAGQASVLLLIAAYALIAWALIGALRRTAPAGAALTGPAERRP